MTTIAEPTTVDVPSAPTDMADTPIVDIPQYSELISYLQQTIADARKYVSIVKFMQRGHLGLLKKSLKKKRNATTGNGVPSGFNKPVTLSPEMASFLNFGPDQLTTRSEVTKILTKYFKDHNLQNPENRREILFIGKEGESLKALFPSLNGEKLSFFNLQRHLKEHFRNVQPEAEAPAASAAAAPVPEPPKVKVVKKLVRKN